MATKEEIPYLVDSEELGSFSIDFNQFGTGSYVPLEDVMGIPQDHLGLSPLFPDESTTDIALAKMEPQPFVPEPHYGSPETGAYRGKYNFEIQINSSHTHKNKYLYSLKLGRIYVDMGVNFSIQFSWDFAAAPWPLYVRATTVFSDRSQAEKRVERCLQHKHASGDPDLGPVDVQHVLRSTRAPRSPGVHYCGDARRADSWYSVLVLFPHAPDDGSQAHTHAYQFACKNSCSTGINRRGIAVVFTLEDHTGQVFGRQTLGARVCACPRRDMRKDEAEETPKPGKRRVKAEPAEAAAPAPAKKLRLEADDERVYTLPAGIQIVGASTLSTGLNVMVKMMEQCANYQRNDAKAQEKYSKAIASIKAVLDQFKTQP